MTRINAQGLAGALALALLALGARHRITLTRAFSDMAQYLGDALKADQRAGIIVPLP